MEKELETEVEKKFGGGKAKIGLVVCAVLVVILAIYSLWSFTRVTYWGTQAARWEALAYARAGIIDSLQNQVDSLTDENNYLWDENDYLRDEIELARFDFYYVLPIEQKFGVYALDGELNSGYWVDPYQVNVFDCSEMSAYMEWELENLGWHTKIVVGDSPFGSGYHAWLLVECEEGGYMPVEATTPEIIWWDNPYFDNYWEYDYSFETILDVFEYFDETEFDWWN